MSKSSAAPPSKDDNAISRSAAGKPIPHSSARRDSQTQCRSGRSTVKMRALRERIAASNLAPPPLPESEASLHRAASFRGPAATLFQPAARNLMQSSGSSPAMSSSRYPPAASNASTRIMTSPPQAEHFAKRNIPFVDRTFDCRSIDQDSVPVCRPSTAQTLSLEFRKDIAALGQVSFSSQSPSINCT